MAGRSAAVAGLISGADISRRLFSLCAKGKPRPMGRGSNWLAPEVERSVALTEQLQQQREQVDEVQIQRQRTGDGGPLRDVTALRSIAVDVVVLQPLGVIGGEAGEDQHANDR